MSVSTKTPIAPPLRIAIVGGGPSGLTLASILQRKTQELGLVNDQAPWHVTVYEAEQSDVGRRLGGSLDLNYKGGLAAIVAAGLLNRFNDFARPEDQEVKAMSRFGELVFHKADKPDVSSERYNPEIDRADLNQVLCESLVDGTIHWNHKVLDIQRVGDEYTLRFANGETVEADLVVGADGAWSRVRPLVTSETPEYSGVTFLGWAIKDFDRRFPELVDLVGHGSLFSYGQGNVLVTQRNGYGVLRMYLGFKAPEDWGKTSAIASASTDEERVQILVDSHYRDWDTQFQQLIVAAGKPLEDESPDQESKMMIKGLYALPTGIVWSNRKRVTLLGDAAHLMSPCAGEGVNMAMVDALELAQAIAGALADDHAAADVDFKVAALNAIADYETKMFARVQEPMQRAAYNLDLFVNEPECDLASVKKRFTKEFKEKEAA